MSSSSSNGKKVIDAAIIPIPKTRTAQPIPIKNSQPLREDLILPAVRATFQKNPEKIQQTYPVTSNAMNAQAVQAAQRAAYNPALYNHFGYTGQQQAPQGQGGVAQQAYAYAAPFAYPTGHVMGFNQYKQTAAQSSAQQAAFALQASLQHQSQQPKPSQTTQQTTTTTTTTPATDKLISKLATKAINNVAKNAAMSSSTKTVDHETIDKLIALSQETQKKENISASYQKAMEQVSLNKVFFGVVGCVY